MKILEEVKNFIDNELSQYPNLVPLSKGGDLTDLRKSLKYKQDAISKLQIFETQFNEFCSNKKVTEHEHEEIQKYLNEKIEETINSIMQR